MSKWIIGFCVFFICNQARSQQDEVRAFIFGHSLIDHRPPLNPTPSDETTVPHWVYLLAEAGGNSFSAGGQYGFLPQHANLPPISQWGYDLVPGVWDPDVESFQEAQINVAMITAANFIQYQPPSAPYEDPNNTDQTTPISASEQIIDWLEDNTEDASIFIYENWPDMAVAIGDVFPPTQEQFKVYWNTTNLTFHEWWLEYHDALLESRSASQVRMIPVGPVLGNIFTKFIKDVPSENLFEDDAPHGTPSIYFLAGLTTYMSIFQEKAPLEFEVPAIIVDEIRNNYADIVEFIWTYLLEFDDDDGNSRVFSGLSTKTEHVEVSSLLFYPNPAQEFIAIETEGESGHLEIIDIEGRKLLSIRNVASSRIKISDLPAGVYFAAFTSDSGKFRRSKFVKL